jgi:hypothetical protein
MRELGVGSQRGKRGRKVSITIGLRLKASKAGVRVRETEPAPSVVI